MFLLFPSGYFAPRWTRWLLLTFPLTSVQHQFFADWSAHLPGWSHLLALLDFVGSVLLLVLAQLYRYRRVSTPVQRQQTKWILFSLIMQVGVLLGGGFLGSSFPSLNGSLYDPVYASVNALVSLLVPVSFAIAILHYRLWDIDAIINKALVYGLLTGILGALYAGLIIGLESLAGLLGGQDANNPLVLVVSTLVIAALFLPVRRRIQSIIDRRFYRRKYDAEGCCAPGHRRPTTPQSARRTGPGRHHSTGD